MKLIQTDYAVVAEDETDGRWAQGQIVGTLFAVSTGEGDEVGKLMWMEPDEAIAFADAMKAKAQQMKQEQA